MMKLSGKLFSIINLNTQSYKFQENRKLSFGANFRFTPAFSVDTDILGF